MLIDADKLIKSFHQAYTYGVLNDIDDIFEVIDNEPEVEAIPVEWLKNQFPTNARYSGEAYKSKARIVRGLIREYQDYLFNKQIHTMVEEIDDGRDKV